MQHKWRGAGVFLAAVVMIGAADVGVAAAEGNVVSANSTRGGGCDFSTRIEIVGGGGTVSVIGDAPTGMIAVGDTNPAGGDLAGGVAVSDGMYELQWDGAATGGEALAFTIVVDGVAISVPVEIPVCDDLASIATDAAYEAFIANMPVVEPAPPAVGPPTPEPAPALVELEPAEMEPVSDDTVIGSVQGTVEVESGQDSMVLIDLTASPGSGYQAAVNDDSDGSYTFNITFTAANNDENDDNNS